MCFSGQRSHICLHLTTSSHKTYIMSRRSWEKYLSVLPAHFIIYFWLEQAPLNVSDPIADTESFDFGSCVALHRFLYDHWDHVRQKLVLRERKTSTLSPLEISKGEIPILGALRNLITNLGPPPMDISWNRPSIAHNIPPSYSRFQYFMLRNAGRNTDSLVSSRAVYDGGESKVGCYRCSVECILTCIRMGYQWSVSYSATLILKRQITIYSYSVI